MLDADLRLGADSTVVFAADAVELLDGRLYVDTRGSRLGELRIVTRAGTFEHLGTQYLVSVEAGEVVGAVREGRIVLHGPTGDVTLAASDPAASMVVVSSGGELTTRAVSSTAELWHWVADLSPFQRMLLLRVIRPEGHIASLLGASPKLHVGVYSCAPPPRRPPRCTIHGGAPRRWSRLAA